ncbi:hypothetical protein ACFP51_01060 [Streptomyces pratens]|uniref:Uncharacterized protein n=1 Tax=Streptomyces pratens TaxID=887456 RepID=A0ABW1LSZ2_9ACTN
MLGDHRHVGGQIDHASQTPDEDVAGELGGVQFAPGGTSVGRRRPDPDSGHGAGISIGGNNNAPLQNVVGQNISSIHQSASVQGTVDIDAVRGLLAAFRADVDRNAADLQNATVLRAMADTVGTSLATPDAPQVGTLRGIAQALPVLVVGTAVQQGGEALANAIGGLLS